ncbi:hypothetical protein TFLX_06278 [Thermoflexales bacterium]|jgi:uncharacterized damage-inducible protein DinB|nr:hypothetical protein TFLX_06278 [Thermoflexales bacterium]
MADDRATLTEIYAGWENYQMHLINAVVSLTAEQLALRAAPPLRTVGQLAAHIIGARARWLKNFLGEGGSELEAVTLYGGPDQPIPNAAELVAGLQVTWSNLKESLARWNADDLAVSFTRTYRGETTTLSRRWVVWHLLEHDLHHGGELLLTLGMHGLPTPDI